MKFYTNVHQIGDHILVRGYENGKRFDDRIEKILNIRLLMVNLYLLSNQVQ